MTYFINDLAMFMTTTLTSHWIKTNEGLSKKERKPNKSKIYYDKV